MNLHQIVTTAPAFALLKDLPEECPIFGMHSTTKQLMGMILYSRVDDSNSKQWFFALGPDAMFAGRYYESRNDLIVALEDAGMELYVDFPTTASTT